MRRALRARKLLVASVGVATATYVACTSGDNALRYPGPDGNLMPPPFDAGADAPVDAGTDAIQDAATDSNDEGG